MFNKIYTMNIEKTTSKKEFVKLEELKSEATKMSKFHKNKEIIMINNDMQGSLFDEIK